MRVDYTRERGNFQSRQKTFKIVELEKLLSRLSDLDFNCMPKSVCDNFEDLMLDVECELDVRNHVSTEPSGEVVTLDKRKVVDRIEVIQTSDRLSVCLFDSEKGNLAYHAERELIKTVLEHTKGNKTFASEILGLSYKTLGNKMNGYREKGEMSYVSLQ